MVTLFEVNGVDKENLLDVNSLKRSELGLTARSPLVYDTFHDEILAALVILLNSKPSWLEASLLTSEIIAILNRVSNVFYNKKNRTTNKDLDDDFMNTVNIFITDAFTFTAGKLMATMMAFSSCMDQASCSNEPYFKIFKAYLSLPEVNKKFITNILDRGGMCMYPRLNTVGPNQPGLTHYWEAPSKVAYTAYMDCDLLLFWYLVKRFKMVTNQGDDTGNIKSELDNIYDFNDLLSGAIDIDYRDFINVYRSLCLVPGSSDRNKERIEQIDLFVFNQLWQLSCDHLLWNITDGRSEFSTTNEKNTGDYAIFREAGKQSTRLLRKIKFVRIDYKEDKRGAEPNIYCRFTDDSGMQGNEFLYVTSQPFLAYYCKKYLEKYNKERKQSLGTAGYQDVGYVAIRGDDASGKRRKELEKELAKPSSQKRQILIAIETEAFTPGNYRVPAGLNVENDTFVNYIIALTMSFLKFNGDSFHLLNYLAIKSALSELGEVGKGNLVWILCQEIALTQRLLKLGAPAFIKVFGALQNNNCTI